MKNNKKYFISLGIGLFFLIGVIVFFYYNDPTKLIESIGANGYLFIFLFGILGGVSSLTAGSFFATVIAFAVGGLEPAFLAIVGGSGMLIGDLVFYFLGKTGKNALGPRAQIFVEKYTKKVQGRPYWQIAIFAYLYTAFTPLPGDILSVGLAFAGYDIKRAALPMWLGNMTLLFLLTTFGSSLYTRFILLN